MKKHTLCVDLDGVLRDSDYLLVDGAIAWLNRIVRSFRVVILTAQAEDRRPGFPEEINTWLRRNYYRGPTLEVTNRKPVAVLYIDDRAWRFQGRFPDAREIHALERTAGT